MDESAIQLTDEDLQGAREAICLHPALVEGRNPAELERRLAQLHHHWGRDTFRLVVGLREPANEAEQCLRELYFGALTTTEARKRLSAYVHRAVDEQMLRVFFTELGQQVHRYGRFMQEAGDLFLNPSRQPVQESDEVEIGRLASSIGAKSALYKQEITSVFRFLQEARVAKRMGNVRLGEHSTPTAAEMVVLVSQYAQESWKSNRGIGRKSQTHPDYIRSVPAAVLFGKTMYRDLPRAQEVQTLLDEEYALARLYLQKCRVAQDAVAIVADDAPPGAEKCLLTVEHWSDLAIGIDEQGRYWALTPAPDLGQPFTKSHAVELPLRGDRWKTVLKAFAESTPADSVRRSDLIQMLGYLPPSQPAERDNRARPGAVESARIEGMQVRQLVAVNRLKDTLADLRRELGKLVDGPTDRATICLRSQAEVVQSGFRVRYLLKDSSDRLSFGARP